jgi:thymidylate kinase
MHKYSIRFKPLDDDDGALINCNRNFADNFSTARLRLTTMTTPSTTQIEEFRYSKESADFISGIFDCFKKEGIRYCVLHSYDSLPELAISDIDIAVASPDIKKMDTVIFGLANEMGFKVIQKLYYDIPASYFYIIFFRTKQGQSGFVQLDIMNDYYGINAYFIKTDVIVSSRKKYKNFYIPDPPVEACYLLIKKVVKQVLDQDHKLLIRKLIEENEQGAEHLFMRYFGRRSLGMIKNEIWGTGSSNDTVSLRRLRRSLTLRNRIFKPHILTLKGGWFLRRFIERVINPTGIVITFLSPDGGGKSVVVSELLKRLRYGFRRTKRIHWRPNLLPPPRKLLRPCQWRTPEEPNYNPHHAPPKGKVSSILRFFYYVLDYVFGYLKLHWNMIRSGLVLTERYYYDFLIDLKRFKLDLPASLPRRIMSIIPKPDLVILLKGPAQVIYDRKQEISLNEIQRQLDKMTALTSEIPNLHEVNIDQSLDNELMEIEDIIIDTLTMRLKRRIVEETRG